MEACELLGGDACSAQMYPEGKLASAAEVAGRREEEAVDNAAESAMGNDGGEERTRGTAVGNRRSRIKAGGILC